MPKYTVHYNNGMQGDDLVVPKDVAGVLSIAPEILWFFGWKAAFKGQDDLGNRIYRGPAFIQGLRYLWRFLTNA